MRLLILIDGTTLKARYKSKLVIATCQGVNIQIYHFTFNKTNSENDQGMYWFYTKLRETIGNVKNPIFVTDRKKLLQ